MIAPSVLLYVIDFFDCRVVFLCTSLLDISHPHLDGRKQQVKTICGRTCCARYCCRKPKVDEIMSREVDCYFYLLQRWRKMIKRASTGWRLMREGSPSVGEHWHHGEVGCLWWDSFDFVYRIASWSSDGECWSYRW